MAADRTPTGRPAAPMSALARGPMARLLYLVHRALQKLSGGRAALHAYLICAQPIGAPVYRAIRPDPRVSVELAGPAHPALADLPRPPEVLARRFAADAECHVILVNGDFGGCIWLAQGQYDEDEVRCRFYLPTHPLAVWDFDVYVLPELRASRTLARLWQAVDAQLDARGVKWTCSRISLFNPASLQAHERLGARHVAVATFLRLGPLQLTCFSRRPFVHLGIRATSVPAVQLEMPANAP